jgi:DNA polymerase gamma 1
MKKTALGYPVLSDDLHHQMFGMEKAPQMGPLAKSKAEKLLAQFGIQTPVDHPENLYDGSLPLPRLKGDSLQAHFEEIATQQVGRYKELADEFAECELPSLPPKEEFVYQRGWTRYSLNGEIWEKESVEYPLENALTFDTETFVKGGAFPVIGTALSAEATYIWLAAELIDPTIPQSEWDQTELIPIGKDKFIAGHNISYDRVRAKEGYSLEHTKPENFYFDTLSAHIGVSGLASGQRWLYVLAGKDPDNLTEEEKRKLRYAPKWLEKGATNSLVQCYNFHVYEVRKYFGNENVRPLNQGDKKVRDIFVDATHMSQITEMIDIAVEYAVRDAYYTAELFQALWAKYLDSTPSMVALCGHYHLNGSVVPLVDDWEEWIRKVEKVYHEHNEEMTKLCKELVTKTYEEWKEGDREELEKRDPWTSQLDWEVKTTKGKYAGIPNWVRPFIKDPDQHIGVKSNLAHLLLKLKYEGSPMILTKEDGWCYHNQEGELTKIPHPKGNGDNVGGVLSKDFVQDMEVGRLSSDLPEAKRALKIANATSYWTSVRKRVMDRIFLTAHNPHGEDALVTLPEILCHGTVTRRTVENLFVTMCSTKNWRIGTELKTRVKAPEGWKIVGADFDGQEMQVASIYSDKWEGGYSGCSPFGYNVLSGSKEAGTDPHSALATLAGVDRDTAKIAGFAILYGAGVKAVQTYIRRKYPDKSPSEVKTFAYKILEGKKGRLYNGLYEGGSDSGCFNYMEGIAMRSKLPTLPCLGTKISTAMRPSAVGSDFKTGRVNWTIQSSGAEILSIILTAVHWLAEEYKIPCRFVLSIHDEVWFMTPDKYAEQFAVLFQIAHMYTWSLFQSAVGIPELPLSRAYFSSVAIDNRIRKSPKECTVTPSNPEGKEEPNGTEHSMKELSEMGAIDKLKTRYQAIQKELI